MLQRSTNDAYLLWKDAVTSNAILNFSLVIIPLRPWRKAIETATIVNGQLGDFQ